MPQSHSTPAATADKPAKPSKPYPWFPLTAHPAGYWCKKIRGKLHYFGPWADPDAALAKLERTIAPVARAYNNNTTQLRKLRKKLEDSMPQLASHLKASFQPKAGSYCVGYYPPAGDPLWNVENPPA